MIGCRYATLEELYRRQTPGGEHRWLTPREQRLYAQLRAGSRRATWLAGRMLAKRLIADYAAANRLELPTVDRARVEIDTGQFGQRLAPRIRIADQTLPWSLSISHSQHGVLVALTSSTTVRIGVDLVVPARYGQGFSDLWFTPAEQRWLRRSRDPRWPSILWGAKEAAYKAVNQDEPFFPRQIEILPAPNHTLHCLRPVPELAFHMARTRQNEIAVVALWNSNDYELQTAH